MSTSFSADVLYEVLRDLRITRYSVRTYLNKNKQEVVDEISKLIELVHDTAEYVQLEHQQLFNRTLAPNDDYSMISPDSSFWVSARCFNSRVKCATKCFIVDGVDDGKHRHLLYGHVEDKQKLVLMPHLYHFVDTYIKQQDLTAYDDMMNEITRLRHACFCVRNCMKKYL